MRNTPNIPAYGHLSKTYFEILFIEFFFYINKGIKDKSKLSIRITVTIRSYLQSVAIFI